MLTSLAAVLAGIWLILDSQQHPTTTTTLIFGIVIGVLALVDITRPYWHRTA